MSKKANPLLISTVATIAYTLWMEHTASHNQRFPYPFLGERRSTPAELSQRTAELTAISSADTMKPLARVIFYTCMVPVLLGLFYLSNAVHDGIR